MATTIESIQQLYIAFFNRPADAGGLDFWVKSVNAGTSLASIGAQFAAQAEYKAEYGGKSPEATVAQIYQNLFNRLPDPTGLAFWSQGLRAGTYTVDNIVAEVAASAQQDPAKGPDTVAVQSKVAAAVAFTDYLKTDTAALIAYSTGSVNGVAKDYIAGVTNATTLADATAGLADVGTSLVEGGNPGSAFALTTGIDTFPGTAGNDTFTAASTASAGHALSGLDSIDGGAGIDTLVVTSSKGADINFAAATVTNVEKLTVRSVSDLSTVSAAISNAANISGYTGLTSATFDLTSTAGKDVAITAAKTTSVTITDNGAGKAAVIGGGGAISVTTDGAVTVGGGVANAYTSVTVVDAAGATITDNSGASAAVGKTLTTVTLDSLTAASTVTGNGITTLNYSNTDKAVAITSTVAHALTVNVDGLETGAKVTENKANAVTVNAAGDAKFVLEADGAKSLAVAGKGDVTLGAGSYDKLTAVTFSGSGSFKATFDNTNAAELLSINSSTATGSLDVTIVGTNNAADPDAENAQSVTGGAGDDKVTITGTLGKGSTLSLGGGSDTVAISGAGIILGDAVVDAGAGTDTLALAVVDATNVGSFKNFELFDVAAVEGQFDQEILDTKNTVSGFVGTAALANDAELLNLGAGVGFTVLGDMTGTGEVLTLTQATAGAITITSNVDSEEDAGEVDTSAAFSTNATSVKLVFDNNNVDEEDNSATLAVDAAAATKVDIVSGGSEVKNFVEVTSADKVAAVTVTGAAHLTLDLAGAAPALAKLTSVDASAATGGITLDTTQLAADAVVKLGSGDDMINVGVVAVADIVTLNGLEKGSEAELDEQDGFDVVHFGATAVAVADDVDAASAGAFSIKDGLYKLGSGVTSPDLAFAQVNTEVDTAGDAVVFSYNNSYFLFIQGGDNTILTDDVLVKLTGTSGIKGLSEVGATDGLYLI